MCTKEDLALFLQDDTKRPIIWSYLQKKLMLFFINQHNLILNTMSLPLFPSQALSLSKFVFSEILEESPNWNLCLSYSKSPDAFLKQISTRYFPSQSFNGSSLHKEKNPKTLAWLSHTKLFAVLKTFFHPLVSLQVVPSAHNVPCLA